MTSGDVAKGRSAPWLAMALLFVGLFGATVAASGLWAPLPPNARGTCGPGLGSETAIEALVDPGSIGAGAEPPPTNHTARAEWNQFVDDCQTATDHRALVTIPVLVVSLALGVAGLVLLWRRIGRSDDRGPAAGQRWPANPGEPQEHPPLYSASFPAAAGPPAPPGAPVGR